MFYITFFRTQPTIPNELWCNVNTVISRMQRYIVPVRGDNFCFLTSIIEALKEDHGIFIMVPKNTAIDT